MNSTEDPPESLGIYSFPSSFIKALLDTLELPKGARMLIASFDWGVHNQAISLGYDVVSVDTRQGYEAAFNTIAAAGDVDGALILPPFGVRVPDQFIPANLQAFSTRMLEDLLVISAANSLRANAKLVALVPASFLFAAGRQEVRRWMIGQGLYAVVEIPRHLRLFDNVAISMGIVLVQRTSGPSASPIALFGGVETEMSDANELYTVLNRIAMRPTDGQFRQLSIDELSKDLRLDPQHYSPEYLNLTPPDGYRDLSLGELATVTGGLSVSREQRTERRTEELDTPYIQVRHVLKDGTLSENPFWIPSEAIRNLVDRVALPGDILVTTSGTIGRVAVVPEHFENGVLFDTSLRRIRLHENGVIDANSLAEFLRSDIGQLQMNRLAGGVAQLHLTSASLAAVRVFVRPLSATVNEPETSYNPNGSAGSSYESAQAAGYADIIESEIIKFLRAVRTDDEGWQDAFRTKWRKLSADPDWKGWEMTVLEDLPTPIAIPFRRYQMARHNPYERLARMTSLVEACIYFTFHVVLADFLRSGWTDPYRPTGDALNAVRGRQSIDHRLKFIAEVLQLANCQVVKIGDQMRDSVRNPIAHSAPGSEPFVRSLVEHFAGDVKTLLESMTVLKGYTLCRIRSHYLHQGILRYQIERFRGAEYDFNMAEASYDQQETPTPELLRAEREHLVLLSPDDEILDLYPFYQLYYGDETARESHLCFMKQTRSVDRHITQLTGESVRNSREIELPGSAEYDRLLDRLQESRA